MKLTKEVIRHLLCIFFLTIIFLTATFLVLSILYISLYERDVGVIIVSSRDSNVKQGISLSFAKFENLNHSTIKPPSNENNKVNLLTNILITNLKLHPLFSNS